MLEAGRSDIVAAFEAIAKFVLGNPAQGGIDGRSFGLPPPRLCHCHGLDLHRIDAR